tara:strand:+ start:97 stop:882 length:786 start_codon:yes stop_codon:yes gene_type:complete
MKNISICIPTHDRGEDGPKWMRELLNSIKVQTFQDFDIVVVDESEDATILDTCKEYSDDFEFTYINCHHLKDDGITAKWNVGIDECTGHIVKFMGSDDVFVNSDALQIINDYYRDNNSKWAFSGFCEMTNDGSKFFNPKDPVWSDYTLEGRNFLSAPSNLSFRKDCKEHFDTNIKHCLDTEFYHRMRWKYGMPDFISGTLIANRENKNRVGSSNCDMIFEHPEGGWMVNSKELEYIKEKHKEFYNNGRKYPDEIKVKKIEV